MPSRGQKTVHLYLSDDLLARIDEARGLIPRAAWVRDAIRERLEAEASAPTKVRPKRPKLEDMPELLPKPRRRPKRREAPKLEELRPKVHKFTPVSDTVKLVCKECGQSPSHIFHRP